MTETKKPEVRVVLASLLALLFVNPWFKGFPNAGIEQVRERLMRFLSILAGLAIGQWRFGDDRTAIASSRRFRWEVLVNGENKEYMGHYLGLLIQRHFPGGRFLGEDFPVEDVYRELLVVSEMDRNEVCLGTDGEEGMAILTPVEVLAEVMHLNHMYYTKQSGGEPGSLRELVGMILEDVKFLKGLPDEKLHPRTRDRKSAKGGDRKPRERDRAPKRFSTGPTAKPALGDEPSLLDLRREMAEAKAARAALDPGRETEDERQRAFAEGERRGEELDAQLKKELGGGAPPAEREFTAAVVDDPEPEAETPATEEPVENATAEAPAETAAEAPAETEAAGETAEETVPPNSAGAG